MLSCTVSVKAPAAPARPIRANVDLSAIASTPLIAVEPSPVARTPLTARPPIDIVRESRAPSSEPTVNPYAIAPSLLEFDL